MNSPSETSAYIATVDADHTVRLPDSVPAGARVAVVVIAPVSEGSECKVRFEAALSAVREAIELGYGTKVPSDEDVSRLVDQARKRHNNFTLLPVNARSTT